MRDVGTLTEQESKDQFFREIAELAERMVAAHGKEFSMGALVLAARFIAENRSFEQRAATQ
ncbi:hypothetical protein I6F35_05600 [Bradyrhizobium sp. BRP22]|uniref:hypothetical protein n=1 Tax=Bradyrhizobium sp. BRP22 TaxID=2793821 RepID=UPI001CD28F88|nr:hypothetical protein [Bradyrhizobium sp. BRP22]MCA1452693.1 hypothetical protein [Bradyrhizobium sp. BRP22]